MRLHAAASRVVSLALVVIGAMVSARAVVAVGTDAVALGYVVGPGLVAAGALRIALQRRLTPCDRNTSAGEVPRG